MNKHTKIVATIGPSCEDVATLERMIKAGMNFARLNFSHGKYEWHERIIKNIREAAAKTGEPIGILQDLQGPRIRVGEMPDKGVVVEVGKEVVLDTSVQKYEGSSIPVDQPDLHKYLQPGQRILINDGHIELKVKKVVDTKIFAEVIEGGPILNHKGINLPDSRTTIPALSEKDRKDLLFGLKNGVDMIGLSFVSSANDIIDVKFLMEDYIKKEKLNVPKLPLIVAKIERHEAVENIKEIVETASGIMVARGDLGLELPLEEVPLIQKRIIDAARAQAKPVIVATQLLDSMSVSRRPTRAEASDVANAVIDHADALMLSGETASGKHPIQVIETMAKIIVSTEKSAYDDMPLPQITKETSTEQAVSKFSRILAEEIGAKLILTASISGQTGRLVSRSRPKVPIYVAANDEIVSRQLNLSWGVKPFVLPFCHSIEEFVERSMEYLKSHKSGKNGDKMVVLAGEPMGQIGGVNLVEVREIK